MLADLRAALAGDACNWPSSPWWRWPAATRPSSRSCQLCATAPEGNALAGEFLPVAEARAC